VNTGRSRAQAASTGFRISTSRLDWLTNKQATCTKSGNHRLPGPET